MVGIIAARRPGVFTGLGRGRGRERQTRDGEPATYVLNDTNLGCADVVNESRHPASLVIIDGASC
jgi:hypothetical protein